MYSSLTKLDMVIISLLAGNDCCDIHLGERTSDFCGKRQTLPSSRLFETTTGRGYGTRRRTRKRISPWTFEAMSIRQPEMLAGRGSTGHRLQAVRDGRGMSEPQQPGVRHRADDTATWLRQQWRARHSARTCVRQRPQYLFVSEASPTCSKNGTVMSRFRSACSHCRACSIFLGSALLSCDERMLTSQAQGHSLSVARALGSAVRGLLILP